LPYFQDTLQCERYTKHDKVGHSEYQSVLAKGKPKEASQLPYFQDTLQYKMYGQHGKARYDEYHLRLAEGKPGEASQLPYFARSSTR